MANTLVAYASMAGSTKEVAERIVQTLTAGGAQAVSQPISAVTSLDGYDSVIVAAPMIVGWHRDAQKFVKRFADRLATMPVAYCVTCYEFTDTGVDAVQGVPITIDPNFRKHAKDPNKLSIKQKNTTASAYLGGILKGVPGVKPVDVGVFKGVIAFNKLGFFSMLFVRVLIGAKPGDYRNWDAITAWAKSVSARLG